MNIPVAIMIGAASLQGCKWGLKTLTYTFDSYERDLKKALWFGALSLGVGGGLVGFSAQPIKPVTTVASVASQTPNS